MNGQRGFRDVERRLRELSRQGDPPEKLAAPVDFGLFRPVLDEAPGRRNAARGGRPPFDAVLKFRMLVLQALHGLSLEQTEWLARDRLSWMRFCGPGLGDTVPDADTPWDFREALIAAKALDALFSRPDQAIADAGCLPMSGRIIDATPVSAPRQRNADGEKERIKAGKRARDIWPEKPARARRKDVDARWTVKFAKAKPAPDGTDRPDIAIPTFGHDAHVCIDRRHDVIRRRITTDAAARDGARLREGLIDPNDTASDVWADTAGRSRANEDFLRGIGNISRIHMKKPKGKTMAKRTSQANAGKPAVRSRVEHPFAVLKGPMRRMARAIGKARAESTIALAAMACNMKR